MKKRNLYQLVLEDPQACSLYHSLSDAVQQGLVDFADRIGTVDELRLQINALCARPGGRGPADPVQKR